VPGGVELLEVHKVVIVEGNYMLNYDDPLWLPLRDLFDEKVFLTLCASHFILDLNSSPQMIICSVVRFM
jgi:pantothenate kinase